MEETATFADCVATMLRLGEADPKRVSVAVRARGDQVAAALRDAMRPGTRYAQRLLALIDLYLQVTFEMLVDASRFGDRIDFAEAETKAWAVAGALDRAVEALRAGDGDTVLAAMMAAESLLGLDITSP